MWYILNFIPPRPRLTPQSVVEEFLRLHPYAELELFAPRFVKMENCNGKLIRRDAPLTYHYTFLRSPDPDIVKALCAQARGFSFILNHASDAERYLTISDADVSSFRQIARAYGNDLPCYPLADLHLEDGDLVEVVSGDFPGLRGTYISRQGSRRGNLYIAVSQSLATVAYDIHADYIRVLRFARSTRRAYDQIEAIVPRLLRAHELDSRGEPLPPELLSHLITFSRRLGEVNLSDNPKLNAKLQGLLLAAARLLGDTAGAARAADRFARLRPHLTNPKTLALLTTLQISHKS